MHIQFISIRLFIVYYTQLYLKKMVCLKAILPPLMDKGLASSVNEVKAISIATLMKITKSAGPLLGTVLKPSAMNQSVSGTFDLSIMMRIMP